MTIVAADLKFLPAERATDVLTSVAGQGGGGYASSPVVQDNVSNNVFPNVMPADRTTGRRQLRRVFTAVLSNENSLAAGVALAFSARPTDANVEICAFLPAWPAADDTSAWGGGTAVPAVRARSAYWAGQALDTVRFESNHRTPYGFPSGYVGGLTFIGGVYGTRIGTASITTANVGNLQSFSADSGVVAGTTFKVGDKVRAYLPPTEASPGSIDLGIPDVQWRTVTALNTGAGTMTLSGSFPGSAWSAARTVQLWLQRGPSTAVIAPGLTTGSVSAGAQDLTLDRLEVRVSPAAWAPSTPGYVATNAIADLGGKAPAFRVGARVLIQHPSTPATREVRTIEFVNYSTGVVRVTAGLTNAYPSGSIVCMLLELGDLQAAVTLTPFAQQAWTRVWQDTAIGAPISPRYAGAVAMNNAGGIEERWAVEFTSTTAFKLTGERLGQIATGNTSSDFIPLNPYTSQPYFTLPASGWGAGWLPGNVLRFNTNGAHSGVWVSRVVSPSSAGGTDQATMLIRADV